MNLDQTKTPPSLVLPATGLAPLSRSRAPPRRGCARPGCARPRWRAAASPSWLRLGGWRERERERERESWLVRDQREIRENREELVGIFQGFRNFYREEGTPLSDLNVRLRSLCKKAPQNFDYCKHTSPLNLPLGQGQDQIDPSLTPHPLMHT